MGKLINKYGIMAEVMLNRRIEEAFSKSKLLDKAKVKDFIVPDHKLVNDQHQIKTKK